MARSIPPQRFGEKLRALRHQYNLTQIDLARELGLSSHTHITNIESGRRTPSLELVLRVASRFQVRVDSLVDDTAAVEVLRGKSYTSQFLQPDPAPHEFGDKLRTLRQRQTLTQAQLAQELGLASHSHIANLEAGRRKPSLELVLLVAEYFQITVEILVDDTSPLASILSPSVENL